MLGCLTSPRSAGQFSAILFLLSLLYSRGASQSSKLASFPPSSVLLVDKGKISGKVSFRLAINLTFKLHMKHLERKLSLIAHKKVSQFSKVGLHPTLHIILHLSGTFIRN